METLPTDEAKAPVARPVYGEDLRISFSCPRCAEMGWVEWKNLSRGMGCRECGCRFSITRGGHLCALHEGPAVRYLCPRCTHHGWLPAALVVRGVECPKCQLPLLRGPDNKLYGPDELAQLLEESATRAAKAASDRDPLEGYRTARTRAGTRPRLGMLAAVGCCLAAAVATGAWYAIHASSTDSAVYKFTRACLAGNWDAAGRHVAEDDAEQQEFLRWKIRNFVSIEQRVRPKGDRVSVEVVLKSDSPFQRDYEVTMSSPFMGVRKHVQSWQQRNNAWYFNPVASMENDGLARRAESAPSVD